MLLSVWDAHFTACQAWSARHIYKLYGYNACFLMLLGLTLNRMLDLYDWVLYIFATHIFFSTFKIEWLDTQMIVFTVSLLETG